VIIHHDKCDICLRRVEVVEEHGTAQCGRCNPGLMSFAQDELKRLRQEAEDTRWFANQARILQEQEDYLPPEG
jgi:aerobic-type carbon monoxide dehydrogenase small subunit (CoxS/CutS family)